MLEYSHPAHRRARPLGGRVKPRAPYTDAQVQAAAWASREAIWPYRAVLARLLGLAEAAFGPPVWSRRSAPCPSCGQPGRVWVFANFPDSPQQLSCQTPTCEQYVSPEGGGQLPLPEELVVWASTHPWRGAV